MWYRIFWRERTRLRRVALSNDGNLLPVFVRLARSRGRVGAQRTLSQALTPVPLTLEFPWGTQLFWGDGQVYLWFRGIWGNDAIKSALMALEQWALEKLEAGAPFDDIFRTFYLVHGDVAVPPPDGGSPPPAKP